MAEAANDSSEASAASHATGVRYGLISLYVHAAVLGAVQMAFLENAAALLTIQLLIASAATYAAVEDSRRRGRSLVHSVQIVFFFTWPLAWLVYLIVTRGWRGVGWWLLHAVGLYAAFFIGVCAAIPLAPS